MSKRLERFSALLFEEAQKLMSLALEISSDGKVKSEKAPAPLKLRLALDALESARRRSEVADPITGDPAWTMLMELYISYQRKESLGMTSLGIASGASHATALRYVDVLVGKGLVEKFKTKRDNRVTIISLTERGVAVIDSYLETHLHRILLLGLTEKNLTF